MPEPIQTMVDLTKANMRLCFGLADAWREHGRKLIEIGGRGTSEVAEEARLALSALADDRPGQTTVDGYLHHFVAEYEALRMATGMQIEEAMDEWRERWSAALSDEPGSDNGDS